MAADFKFELKPAVKEAVPPLIGLWGTSGCGKTYSALLLARGIVGKDGKIAVIDTENGRAKFYADVSAPWMHLDLEPPFTPDKYSAAFKFCEEQGVDIIIVDSMSHVWEGEGGVLDKAEEVGGAGLRKWGVAKMPYKRMMNNLIRSRLPVIFCLRAKEDIQQVGGGKGAKIEKNGFKPIAEKNFVYEMTVDLHLTKDGAYDLETSKTIPTTLRPSIPADGILGEEMGAAIAEWCGAGAEPDEEYLKLKRDGENAATEGVDSYKKWIASLSAAQKPKVKNHHPEWSKLARDADKEKAEEEELAI
jgi:hypothetical protein